MTNAPPNRPQTGPLLQKAPDAHSHPHTHIHTHSNRHPYALQHKHASSPDDSLDSLDASDLAAHLDQRQEPNANDINVPVTQVVQTISLVQYVDPSGNPLEIQTLYAPPATVLVDPSTGNTVAIAPSEDAATPAAPAAGPVASDDTSNAYSAAEAISLPLPLPTDLAPISSALEPIIGTAEVPLTTALPTETTSLLSPSSLESVAESTLPSPSPPTFPSLSTPLNTTNTHSALSISHSFPHNSTRLSVLAYSTTDSASLGLSTSLTDTADAQSRSLTSFLSGSAFSTISSDLTSTHASDSPTSTAIPSQEVGGVGSGNSNGNGVGGQGDVEDSSSSSSDSSESSELSPEHQQVIGGVVGGVAGAAIFVFLVFLLLRRRRRRNGELPFSTNPESNSRDITEGDTAPVMSERAAPAAVMAALSRLTGQGKKRQEEAPAATSEKGFYRVSGRKLPSVLQSGGDGYTDPRETNLEVPGQTNTRESVMSGYSDYYRGSQEFDPRTGGVPRLALGSPMRPISGVPIMRQGPGRKVSVPENPFAEGDETDPFIDPPATQPTHDPLGRSLIGQDSSRGSGSRFQERL